MWGVYYEVEVPIYSQPAPSTSASVTQIRFLASEQRFRITVNGLLPSTVHHFFFERAKVPLSKIKILGGKLGDPLVTDANGSIVFDYYYDAGLTDKVTSVDGAQKLANLTAGKKEVALTNVDTSNLSTGFEESYTSYWKDVIVVEVST